MPGIPQPVLERVIYHHHLLPTLKNKKLSLQKDSTLKLRLTEEKFKYPLTSPLQHAE
jgi:hypothetical protein